MAIISQETFDKFTEEEKKKLKEYLDDNSESVHVNYIVDDIFGKENLQSKPKIKTWKDCQEMNEDSNFFIMMDDNLELPDKVYSKCIATLKIAKLIELGYGGLITNEEWKNIDLPKYTIIPHNKKDEVRIDMVFTRNDKQFVCFHTLDQAQEFISRPENVELVKQYHMI